jgi:hypothetical protein
VIINEPSPGGDPGPGGDDGTPPKPVLAQDSKVEYLAALACGVLALVPGGAEVEVVAGVSAQLAFKVTGLTAGYLAHQLAEAAADPPQSDYKGAPTAVPLRTSLPPAVDAWAEPLVRAATQLRLFIDAIERAQGAFLAADPEWVQRHTVSAIEAYRSSGRALTEVADRLDQLSDTAERAGIRESPTRPDQGTLLAVLEEGAGLVGLPKTELGPLADKFRSLLADHQQDLSPRRLRAAAAASRRLGARLAMPRMTRGRFVFGPHPLRESS